MDSPEEENLPMLRGGPAGGGVVTPRHYCPNKGCDWAAPSTDAAPHELEGHVQVCEHRTNKCGFCGALVRQLDMSAHRAVKRCYETAQKRRLVQSAKGTKAELRDHRAGLTRQRHSSEQVERQITRDYRERDVRWQQIPLARRRAQSAGAALRSVGGNTVLQVRVQSARNPHLYSRNLHSAVLDRTTSHSRSDKLLFLPQSLNKRF